MFKSRVCARKPKQFMNSSNSARKSGQMSREELWQKVVDDNQKHEVEVNLAKEHLTTYV